MKNEKLKINRRKILKVIPAGAAVVVTGTSTNMASAQNTIPIQFKHGVASGDPLQKKVIIWTRVTPNEDNYKGDIAVNWQISADENFTHIVNEGSFITNHDRDYTVKEDVAGLEPGTRYYYRFSVGNSTSVTGETKTLKDSGKEPLKFAVASCSNYPWGYFNGYRAIAESGPYDAVIHLGDYIYEYQVGRYQSPKAEELGRLVDPPHEIKSLSDYRRRYALTVQMKIYKKYIENIRLSVHGMIMNLPIMLMRRARKIMTRVKGNGRLVDEMRPKLIWNGCQSE